MILYAECILVPKIVKLAWDVWACSYWYFSVGHQQSTNEQPAKVARYFIAFQKPGKRQAERKGKDLPELFVFVYKPRGSRRGIILEHASLNWPK